MTDQEQFLYDCNEQFNKVIVIVNDWLKANLGPEPMATPGLELERFAEDGRDTWTLRLNGKKFGNPLTINWGNYQ